MSRTLVGNVSATQKATLTGKLTQTGAVRGTIGGETGLAGKMAAAYGTPGRDGKDGKDGYTPVKGVDYFDGKDGEPGAAGLPGKDGYTPIKGVDYFDGKDGEPGKDGYTPVKGVDYFDGEKGEPGYTPQKGIDYFDGQPGKDGIDGKDGYTPVKGVDYFDGFPGKDGADGQPGKDGYTPVKGVDYFTAEEVQALRDEIVDGVLYTDANYIQGDAKAFIVTDYIPNSNTRVTGKMYFNPGSSVKCMLGARTSTSSKRFDFGNNSSSKYNFGWNAAATAGTMAELPDAFEVDINRNTVYINGEEAITRPDAEFECEYPLAIFGCNTAGTVGAMASGAVIYWLKVYEGDVLMCDFIPRKHLVDGYGMYDRIAKKFYPNAATSGTFTGA